MLEEWEDGCRDHQESKVISYIALIYRTEGNISGLVSPVKSAMGQQLRNILSSGSLLLVEN